MHRMPANSRHGILEALRDGIDRARIGVEVKQLEATAPDDRTRVGQSPDKGIDAIRRQRAAPACASAETAVRQEQHRLVPIPALREPVHNADPPVHKRAPKGIEARESTRVVDVRNGSKANGWRPESGRWRTRYQAAPSGMKRSGSGSTSKRTAATEVRPSR